MEKDGIGNDSLTGKLANYLKVKKRQNKQEISKYLNGNKNEPETEHRYAKFLLYMHLYEKSGVS